MITIQGEVYSSKNSRVTTRSGRTFKSKKAKQNEATFAWQLNAQRETWEKMTEGRTLPLIVVFELRRETKRKFDYNNMMQGVLDSMVACGYLQDDDMVNIVPIPAPWVHAKGNAGVNFWIADVDIYRRLIDGFE